MPNQPKQNKEDMKELANKIPEVRNRELFIKTCDLMFSHYRILKIVDLETALQIIKGVLKNE
jgi:hypothetical protein